MIFGKGRKRQELNVTEGLQRVIFSRRAMLLGGLQAGVGGLLALRLGYLAIVQNEQYSLKSESNRLNLTLIPPRRGWIIDRNGKALADNRVAPRVDIIPDRLQDERRVLSELQTLLRLSPDTMERILEDMKKASGFQPVQIAEDLSEEDFAAISVRLPELPGVAPARAFMRNYPAGAAVAHLVGYVGAASAEDYKKDRNPLLITPGYKIGKDNMERYFDPVLRGKPGARRAEVTAGGDLVRDLGTQPDTPGKPLKLTIDAGLQDYAARRMGTESGAAVVIDCESGDILAFVSMPAFDPNAMSDGVSKLEWGWLNNDERKPLLNKASRGLYPPGSTLKPMGALAALINGVDPKETVFCGGGYRLGNRVFKCLGRHGPMTMESAIEKSCNTYFYAMAHRLGYDAIAPTARMLGLGEEFDLPGINQRYGTVPDSAWKERKFSQPWNSFDSLNAMIGQGYVSVSPLQLAVMSARLASGRMLMPRILAGTSVVAKPLPVPPDYLATVHEGMRRVVNGNGTAVRSRLPLDGIEMAGKTGTAQVRAIRGSQRGQSGARRFRDHGLFVCYAPADTPKYAAAVVIEHGLGGARAAAPVASDFLTYMFDPEQAMAKLESLEAGWGGSIAERMQRDYALYRSARTGEPTPPPRAVPVTTTAPTSPAQPDDRNPEDDSQPAAGPAAGPSGGAATGAATAPATGTTNSAAPQPGGTPR